MNDKILSVFIDESGDFGPYERHAPYYIVSMILHEQSQNIAENIAILDAHVRNLNQPNNAIHVGPLIRRESIYVNDLMEDRKRLFSALFNFARRLPFVYVTAKIIKDQNDDIIDLTAKLTKEMAKILREHQAYFASFDKIIVYYDNGQVELTRILTALFNALFHDVEFRKVSPSDYKLFQVADLVCTLELLETKTTKSGFTHSEKEFFHSSKDFKKNYYKSIVKKQI